jgi:hypothetical protein
MRKYLEIIFPIILIIFTILIVLSPYLLGYVGITPHVGTNDLTDTQVPFRNLLQESLKQGRLPLWEPRISAGFPFLAEGQSGSLHPLNILLSLLPVSAWLSTSFSIVIAIAISAIGMYSYLYYSTSRKSISSFGAIVWALCGFNLNHIAHLNILNVISMLPWQLYILEKIIGNKLSTKKKLQTILTLSLTVALQVLAGHPQFMAYSIAFVLLYWFLNELFIENDQKVKGILTNIIVIGTAIILGACIGAAQIVPTVEFTQYSTRQSGLNEEAINFLSFRIKDLQTLITPFYDFSHEPRSMGRLAQIGWPFDERYSYTGLIPLGLALISLPFIFKDRRTIVISVLSAFFLLLSLGNQSPIGILLRVPPLSLFRIPAKFTLFFQVGVAILSAYALFNLVKLGGKSRKEGNHSLFHIILAILITINVIDTTSKLYKMYPIVKGDWWYDLPQTVKDFRKQLAEEKKDRKDYEHRIIGQNYNDQLQKQYLKQNPELWDKKQIDLFKNNRALIPASNMLIYDLPLLTNAVNSMGLKVKWYSELEERIFYTDYANNTDNNNTNYSPEYWKVAQLVGAKFIIHDTTISNENIELIGKTSFSTNQDQIGIYKFRTTQPFIQSFSNVIQTSEADSLKTILSETFDPTNQMSIIKNNSVTIQKSSENDPQITYAIKSPTELYLKITNSHPTTLLIRQAYYPGWHAELDNEQVTILRADHAFQAIHISKPGTHNLALSYEPLSFKIGIIITGTAIATYVSIFLVFLLKKEERLVD